MGRYTLFSKNNNTNNVSNLQLSVSQPHVRNLYNSTVATGHYDAIEEKWLFECSEPATKRWLDTTFAQPVNVVGGQLPIDSLDFVTYIRDVVMHRKGLMLEIQTKKD
jgi:hypothetical protein